MASIPGKPSSSREPPIAPKSPCEAGELEEPERARRITPERSRDFQRDTKSPIELPKEPSSTDRKLRF